MHDETRRRDARMMEAVYGLGGRSAAAAEVDLRLGLRPDLGGPSGWLLTWLGAFVRRRTAGGPAVPEAGPSGGPPAPGSLAPGGLSRG